MVAASLYRLFDDEGSLLYVGVTNDPTGRIQAHRRKEWGHEIMRTESQEFRSRDMALAAEARAIRTERPSRNRMLPSVSLSASDRQRLRCLARRRDRIARQIAQAIIEARDHGMTLREIADELGVSHGGVAFIEQRQRKGP